MATTINAGTASSGAAISADTTGILQLQSGSTPTTAVTIDASQNVGIGTATPGRKLEIYASGPAIKLNNGTYNWTVGTGGFIDGTDSLVFYSGTVGDVVGRFTGSGIFSAGSSTAPTSTYHSFVTGNAGQVSFRSTLNTAGKYWYLGADGSATPYFILYNQSAVGVYIAPGGTSWTGTSDESLKENLTPISDGLNKVNSLRAVIGNYISDDEKIKHPFLIAQDVEKVLPEAVSLNPEGKLGLSYTEVIPLLVSAIQELNAKVDAQALEIKALKGTA
jgi:hypothetical protein